MASFNVFDDRTTQTLLQIARLYQRNGFFAGNMQRTAGLVTEQEPLYLHNVSGEAIPAYACVQVTGTEEIGDINYLQVDKPADVTGDAGGFVFNSPEEIEIDGNGIAQLGNVVRAFKDTGTVTAGDRWQPVANQWYIEQDDAGIFTACGEDDVDTDVLRIFLSQVAEGGEANVKMFVTPSGGIAARSGATLGSSNCTVLDVSSGSRSVTSITETVYNNFTSAVAGSTDIAAAKVNGIWVVIAEDCSA